MTTKTTRQLTSSIRQLFGLGDKPNHQTKQNLYRSKDSANTITIQKTLYETKGRRGRKEGSVIKGRNKYTA